MSRYGPPDPRTGRQSPNDEGNQGDPRGGLLSRRTPDNAPQNRPPDSRGQDRGQGQQRGYDRAYERGSDRGQDRAPVPPSDARGDQLGGKRGDGGPSRNAPRDDQPRNPRQPASSPHGRNRPAYEPYANAPWNQSWQWSANPQTSEGQAYPSTEYPASDRGDRGHWDERQEYPRGQWEPEDPWDASSQWSAGNQWNVSAQGNLGAPGARDDARTRDAVSPGGYQGGPVDAAKATRDAMRDDAPGSPNRTWQRRLGMTREQWQWEVLRSWPGVLRLLMTMVFAGALIGLLTFSIRPIPVGGTTFSTGALKGPGNIQASPTISLFGNGGPAPFVPTATNTPIPTATTAVAPALSVSPLTVTTDCASGTTSGTTSSATTLTNNSTNAIQFKVKPSDNQISVTGSPPGSSFSGTLPAQQTANISFDGTFACALASPSSHTATISWVPVNGNGQQGSPGKSITVTDNITPVTAAPTATPSPTKTGGGKGTPTASPTP